MLKDTQFLEALPTAIYTTDAEGRITFYNEAAAEFWGHRPTLGTDLWCGSWRLYRLDGTRLPHDECPMAVTLKTGEPVRGVEAIAERPDGTRVRFMPYPTPLRDAEGRVIGAINLLVDVSERAQTEMESAYLAAIVTNSDDAIVSKTLEGQVTSWNAGATRIFGYEPDEMIGQPIKKIIPPELHAEEDDILARLKRGERVHHYETVRLAKDGRRVDISLTVSPVRDRSGRLVGASKVARDITERKQAEALQRLLMEELSHRVKNTLASVQAIASQSLRRAKRPEDFAIAFSSRIQALARTHALLTESKLRGADVGDLVRDQAFLGGSDDPRVSFSGPLLMLDQQATVHLGMVLHELSTNARKYGALSVPNGRVDVTWEMRHNGGRHLLLEWRESGGPRTSAPTSRGFGTTLIEQTLKTCGGSASLRYGTAGVTCKIELPLAEVDFSAFPFARAPARIETGAAAVAPQASPSPLAGKRIIVIEDEPLVSMDIEDSLAAVGCVVAGTAGTLKQAKRLIAEASCDAALLDANLAGRPADELTLALTRRNIPFAFVTGYGREGLPAGFREALMLGKPFDQQHLQSVVEVLLYQTGRTAPANEAVTRLRPAADQ